MNEYNLQFDILCKQLKLGIPVKEPEQIAGGFLHMIYKIETNQGIYAVKALNPEIMKRPTARGNFIQSEQIASVARHNRIPALTAHIYGGEALQQIEGQYYLVFDWIDGKTLEINEINEKACTIMGALLATVHNTNFTDLEIEQVKEENVFIEWKNYLEKGKDQNAAWVDLLERDLYDFYAWSEKASVASQNLSNLFLISHRDMDPKNVLWHKGMPIIIDWESAGYIHPIQELIEDALYWSGFDQGNTHRNLFSSFIQSYQIKRPIQSVNWIIILDSLFANKLNWLEHNLKRSLRIECIDDEEQQLGTSEVFETIEKIIRYAEIMPIILKWLREI